MELDIWTDFLREFPPYYQSFSLKMPEYADFICKITKDCFLGRNLSAIQFNNRVIFTTCLGQEKDNNRKPDTVSPQSDGFRAGKNNLKYKVVGWDCVKRTISTSKFSENGQVAVAMAKQENIPCHDYSSLNNIKQK